MPRAESAVSDRVLVIEDEPDLADLIVHHVSRVAPHAEAVLDGETGLARALTEPWSAVVLDIGLPGRDGRSICTELRAARPSLPILMVTALGSELDRVVGLGLGADDYLVKPFGVLELQARIRALLRRGHLLDAPVQPIDTELIREFASLRIDRNQHRAWDLGHELKLTRREFDLLWHFASDPGQVFSRDALFVAVWGPGHEGFDHTVNSHINRLRRKLDGKQRSSVAVETVWGVGYRLRARS